MRRVGASALVALTATVSALAAPDPPRVLVGRSIGAVRLGMTEAALTAAYGAPKTTTSWRLPGRSGPAARYGALLVYLDRGRVVAVETANARYRLADGVGVGTITPARPNELTYSWRGFRYDACGGAYQRGAYGAVTELVLPFGATTGRRIIAIAVAKSSHRLLLPGASRCD